MHESALVFVSYIVLYHLSITNPSHPLKVYDAVFRSSLASEKYLEQVTTFNKYDGCLYVRVNRVCSSLLSILRLFVYMHMCAYFLVVFENVRSCSDIDM